MKIYKFLRCLAFLLAAVMLIASFPIVSLAQTLEATENETIEETITQPTYENVTESELDNTEKDVYILAEDTTKRGEFEKHYLCSDGTFVAVTYAEAVHYRDDNGEWTDIDNSLSANEASGAYEAQNGDYKISFCTAPVQTPSDVSIAGIQGNTNGTSSNGKLISMQSGDSILSWTLTANKKLQISSGADASLMSENTNEGILSVSSSATASVLGHLKEESGNSGFTKININDESAFDLPKISNTVRYDSLFGEDEGISVRYTAYRNKIEEDIFIERKTDIESFSMSVDCTGLIPVLNSDNSIDFLDKSGELQYHISIPYMIDAAYAVLNDIQVTLSVQGDQCIITYTPNSEWMNSSDRVYPIMLDPSVTTKEYQSNVQDTYFKEGDTADHSDEQYLDISYGNIVAISFSSLPVIHESMPIQKVELNLTLAFAQFNETRLYLEMRNTMLSADDMTYEEYLDSYLVYSTSTSMFPHDTGILFNWTSDFHDSYEYIDGVVFFLKLHADDSNYSYYPICSSENTNGAGPYITITYGYAFEDEFNTGDVISFQNADNGRYIYLGTTQYSTAQTTPNSTNLTLVKNEDTGGYKIRSTANSSLYLTVNDTGGLVWCSDDMPERQEWLFVPTIGGTFYIVRRGNMNQALAVTDVGYYMNGEWVITGGNLYCIPIDVYNCAHCDGNHQEWYLYRSGELVELELGLERVQTGTYFIYNVGYEGFLSRTRDIEKGFAWDLGDKVKWEITNIGNNQYVIQPYSRLAYCLSCSSTGSISLARKEGTLTDNCIWELELSPIFGSELLSIKNKATNKYLYYDGENLVSDDNPTTEENHRWRAYPLDAEYVSILNNTSFSNLNIDIGEPADIDINLPDYFRYASLQDFEYTILSGDDSCVKIMLERGKILGLKAGTVQIQARHVLLDRTFSFYVTVEEQIYSIQIDQDRTFDMRQIINGVSEWRTDNPDVISHSHTTVFECIESGYALVSGYDSDGGLLALVEVRGMTQKDKMLEALTTNETYYLYHHGPCGLNSLASDICSSTSRDFLEVKLVLISSFRLWYNGNLGIEWIKSRIQNYFGLSITTDRAQYVTAEYEVKGLGGYYNPVVQIENLNEFLNNIKALIAMCGFNYAKTLYADDFAANMTTSAQADLQAAYQRRHTVVDVARQSQIANGYSPDNFKTVILKKGDKVYGLLPGPSSWYTTAASVEQSGYNQITLNQGLQIKKSPSLGYRTSVAEYVVKEDIIVAYGTASNNTYVNGEFVGNGGYEQYFIEFFSSVLEYVTETTLIIG